MNIIKLAYRNIISQPLNLLLSIILFALGIGLISFLLQLDKQLSEKFESNLADIHMVVGAKGSPLQMILSSMYHVDYPTGNITVQEATPFLREGHPLIDFSVPLSLGDSYKKYRIVGTDHGILKLYNGAVESGRLWEESMEVTLGKVVAEELGLKLGDTFSSSHGFLEDDNLVHDDTSFKVVGILQGTGSVIDQLILTPSSSVWDSHDHGGEAHTEEEGAHNHDEDDHNHDDDHAGHDHGDEEGHDHSGHDHSDHNHDDHAGHVHTNNRSELLSYADKDITSILVRFKNKANFQALNMPRNINENTDLQAASPAYEMNRLFNMIGSGTDALRWLAILIAFVSAISIFIFLFKSLKDRKYELSLIRVMGGSRKTLFSLILLEGIILALIGYIVGILVSHLSMEYLAGYLKSDYRYSFTGWRWLTEEWWLLLISLGIGIIAALIPAIQASSTDINRTLSQG